MRSSLAVALVGLIIVIAVTHLAPRYSPFPESVQRFLGIPLHIPGTSRVAASAGPLPGIDPGNPLHRSFEETYRAKLANPDYLEWKSRPGLPSGFQDFDEESRIKAIRTELAGRLVAPDGASVVRIPVRKDASIALDGRFSEDEWLEAVALPVGIDGAETMLLLLSDGQRLFLAGAARSDDTEGGFDQLRFYLHIGITPKLVNERLHVGRRGSYRVIRQTDIRYRGPIEEADARRWQKYPISDWNIYQRARGASLVDGYRRYEAVLELQESGLRPGTPFTARVEVETDPHRGEDGKVIGRRYVGRLGSQRAPLWFVIGD